MRKPIEPNAHRVQITTRISPEAAAVYHDSVERHGGSAEAALDSLILGAGKPVPHLSGTLLRQSKKVVSRAESVIAAQEELFAFVDGDLENLNQDLLSTQAHVRDLQEHVIKTRRKITHARKRLGNQDAHKARGMLRGVAEALDRMLESIKTRALR